MHPQFSQMLAPMYHNSYDSQIVICPDPASGISHHFKAGACTSFQRPFGLYLHRCQKSPSTPTTLTPHHHYKSQVTICTDTASGISSHFKRWSFNCLKLTTSAQFWTLFAQMPKVPPSSPHPHHHYNSQVTICTDAA